MTGSGTTRQMANIPTQWETTQGKRRAARHDPHEKSPKIGGTAKIGTAFAMYPASARGSARSPRERQKNGQ
jgi:hypothetical protein